MTTHNIGMTERDLILQVKAGNGTAFSLLVKGYLKRVYGAAYAILRNPDDASDIAQDVFVRVFRSIGTFDDSRPLYPWLYRITRNLCLNHLKRVRGRAGALENEDLLPDASCGPEQTLLRKETSSGIERAVARLPDQYREIIVLKHYQDCSYNEMAEILSIPVGTVMSRLYNARMKLKELLKEQEVRSNDM